MAQAAKKNEPVTELLSISEIARRCGINRATAASRLDDLGYEPDDSSTAKNQLYLFDDEMLFSIKAAKDSLSAAKIRDIRASSQLKELKLAEARGELVPIVDITETVQTVLTRLYKEQTQLQPKRLAARLVKAKTAAEVTRILKTDTDRIFARLREADETLVPAIGKKR